LMNAALAKPIPAVWFISGGKAHLVAGIFPPLVKCTLFFCPRLFRQSNQHFAQLGGSGDPLRKIKA
jgi:hypothetical protein